PVLRKRKARYRRTECFRCGKSFLAAASSSQPDGLLQLHLNPHLANVCSAFLAAEEPILEQINRPLIVPFLYAVQSQFINQTSRHAVQVGIEFKCFHPL